MAVHLACDRHSLHGLLAVPGSCAATVTQASATSAARSSISAVSSAVTAFGLALTIVATNTMQAFINEPGKHIAPEAHALVLMDPAGRPRANDIAVLDNTTPIFHRPARLSPTSSGVCGSPSRSADGRMASGPTTMQPSTKPGNGSPTMPAGPDRGALENRRSPRDANRG